MRGSSEARPGQYLVMPYCAAGSLQAHLLGGGSGLKGYEDRLRIARGLAAGLAHLHSKRIFHRDIKPDNVLLTAKLEPRLADFGVSKAIEAGGGAEMATSYATVHQVGTAGYAAPEVQFGKFGPKTDVYASGVVLLQLATGKPAVTVDKRGAPVPLRDHLLTQHHSPAAGAAAKSDPDAAFSAFAQAQADPRCAWPPRTLAGLLQLGLRCTEPEAHARPPAMELEKVLEDLLRSDGGVSGFGARPDMLASESALTCVICEEALRDCVLLPCNHAVGCGPCTSKLDCCPLCRAAKEGVRLMFGPVLRTWQGPAGGGRGWAPLPASNNASPVERAELAEFVTAKAEKQKIEAEAAWWAAHSKHEAAFAALAAGNVPPSWFRTPDAFDVTVAPGQPVQAAVDGCPADGCVLLLPGAHDGPLVLKAGKKVHVFGRGLATLRAATGTVVTSDAAAATLDGLIIRRQAGGDGSSWMTTIFCCGDVTAGTDYGVWVKGGGLRLQACDITSAEQECVWIEGGTADPVLAACKCVCARAFSSFWSFVCGGERGASVGASLSGVILREFESLTACLPIITLARCR